jgi:hypothetical protein
MFSFFNRNVFVFKLVFFLFIVNAFQAQAMNKVRDPETVRLAGTSGAGIGSILIVESLYLNPAPIAFFNNSVFYAHSSKGKLKDTNTDRTTEDRPFGGNPDGLSIAVTDSSNVSKGGVAYNQYTENSTDRKRYSFNMASIISKSTSVGLLYHFTQDDMTIQSVKKARDFHQMNFGMTYIHSESLSFGAILYDPFKSSRYNSKTGIGIQYVLNKYLTVMLDIGYHYFKNTGNSLFYKGAAQLGILKDLYFRAGVFHDKYLAIRGNSIGVSWIGPKLSVEFASKTTKIKSELNTYLYPSEILQETLFSLSYRM